MGLALGRFVVGVKGLAVLYALGFGILPAIAVVLADLPLSVTILGGTSAFLLGTASVGRAIAWWKRRSTVDPYVYVNDVRATNLGDGSRPTFFVSVANYGSTDARDVMVTVSIDTHHNAQAYKAPQKLDIPSRDAKEVFMRASFAISPKNLEGFNKGHNRLEVSGSVEYRGTSKPYCYQYEPWEGERPEGVPMFVPCDHDERTNQTVKLRAMGVAVSSGFAALTVKRPTPPNEARPEKDRQDALDELARKLKEGVEIKNDRDLPAVVWSQRNQGWHTATKKLLDSRFSSAEASLFRASEPRNVPGGRQDVARDLATLNGQLEVLREIIGSGRAE